MMICYVCCLLKVTKLLNFNFVRFYLEEVSSTPLTAPKVEAATNSGMERANHPNRRSANVTATAAEPSTWNRILN